MICIVFRSGLNTSVFSDTFVDKNIMSSVTSASKSISAIIQIIYFEDKLGVCPQNSKNLERLKDMIAVVHPKPSIISKFSFWSN